MKNKWNLKNYIVDRGIWIGGVELGEGCQRGKQRNVCCVNVDARLWECSWAMIGNSK